MKMAHRWKCSLAIGVVASICVLAGVCLLAIRTTMSSPPAGGSADIPKTPLKEQIAGDKSAAAGADKDTDLSELSKSLVNIAQIDVGRIYEKHQRFLNAMENMKVERDATDASLEADQKNLDELAAKVVSLQGAERLLKEAEHAKLSVDLNTKASLIDKNFTERKKRIYYQVLLEIKEESLAYCKKHDVKLLIRVGDSPVNPRVERDETSQEIDRTVYYSDLAAPTDITDDVLGALNGPGTPKK